MFKSRHISLGLLLLAACGAPPVGTSQALITAPAAEGFDHGVYVPIKELPLGTFGQAQLVANGNAALSFLRSEFDGEIDEGDELAELSAELRLTAALTLELRAEAGGTVSTAVDLATLPLPPFQAAMGDLLIMPTAYARLRVEGSVDAGARASLVIPMSTGVRFQFPGDPGIVQTAPVDVQPAFGAPDLAGLASAQLTAQLEIGVTFLVAVKGIAVGGPAVDTIVGVDIGVDPAAAAPVSATSFVTVTGAWALDPAAQVTLPATQVVLVPRQELPISVPIPATGLANTRWSRIFDLAASEEATGSVLSNGELALVGAGPGLGRPYMTTLDDAGNPAWQTAAVPFVSGPMFPKAMATASDGDLMVVGTNTSASGMRLERYDAAGAGRWAVTMAGPASTLVKWNTLLPNDSGGAVLAGIITYVGNPSTSRLVFAEVASDGVITWQNEVALGAGATAPEIRALARTASGQIIGVGGVSYADNPSAVAATINNKNVLIVRLDAAGNVLGTRAIGGRGTEYATSITTLEDGRYAVGGVMPTQGLDKQEHGSWLALFDDADVQLWSSTYCDENEGLGWAETTGVANARGGLLATGHSRIGTAKDGWMMQVHLENGMPVWWKTVRGAREDHVNGMVALPDGLAIFGRTTSVNTITPLPQTDFWAVRTNVDGMLSFDPATGFEMRNDAVGWAHTKQMVVVQLPTTTTAGALTAATAGLAVAPAGATVTTLSR